MSFWTINIQTSGEKFYNITKEINKTLSDTLEKSNTKSGILVIYIPHTSCGLTISEAFDPSAACDMQNFLKHLAPRNLQFIAHDSEGDDDSPSHMKSIILSSSLNMIVENKKIIMGTWQGIFLAEFRDHQKSRKIYLKFIKDN